MPALGLPDFRLETFFGRWEFNARYHLTASDAQTITLGELLALATDEQRAAFDQLPLGYTPTWGTRELREAIASTYQHCTAENVIVFAGAEEAMYWAMQLFIEPGDHVIVTVPNYQSMESVPLAAGAIVTGLVLDEKADWAIDIDAFRAALRPSTKLVAVNFPNNPTGAVPEHGTWRNLVDLCSERGILLFSDEVYRGLELDPESTLPQAADLSASAMSLNVMSKAYGLPGLRIGWIASRDVRALERLEQAKHYTSICSAGPSELLSAIALNNAGQLLERNRNIIAANVQMFDAFFARHEGLFEWAAPQGGAVTFPRYLGSDGVEAFCRALIETAGVLLLPASIYQSAVAPVPSDRFRIGVGRSDPGPALAAFEDFLTSRTSP